MVTINQIASLVASRYQRPFDVQLKEEIAFAATYWRAFLIRQDVEKNAKSALYVQKITLKTELVDPLDNCYVELDDCKMLRTTVNVPTPIREKRRNPFLYVGTGDYKTPFSYIPVERIATYKNVKLRPTSPLYTFYNNRIYILNIGILDYLAVSGPFENPYEAGEACINSLGKCVDYNDPFYAPADMVKTIVDGLLAGTFSLTPPVDQEVTVNV